MAASGSTANEHSFQPSGSLERTRKNALSVHEVDRKARTPAEWVDRRLRQWPGQSLLAWENGLYCQACKTLLDIKRLKDKSNLRRHFGARHVKRLAKWQRHEATQRQLDMGEALQGSRLSRKEAFLRCVGTDSAHRRRCWAVRTLLKTGVPLNALSERDFRDHVARTDLKAMGSWSRSSTPSCRMCARPWTSQSVEHRLFR